MTFVKIPFDQSAPKLQFRYVNWHGVEHEYVVQAESLERGAYSKEGARPTAPVTWVLHGEVITRDGDPRPEMEPTRRRTFILAEIHTVMEATQ